MLPTVPARGPSALRTARFVRSVLAGSVNETRTVFQQKHPFHRHGPQLDDDIRVRGNDALGHQILTVVRETRTVAEMAVLALRIDLEGEGARSVRRIAHAVANRHPPVVITATVPSRAGRAVERRPEALDRKSGRRRRSPGLLRLLRRTDRPDRDREEEKKEAVKDFNFPKGLAIALLAGFMSGCFNVGLTFGADIHFEGTSPMFRGLPATLLVTMGGFLTNALYCFYQNSKNKTWSDYGKTAVWGNNALFCALAGLLWYSQFFGLSLGQGFLQESPAMLTFSFCILMALNVTFSNVWGIILKEWKGCSPKTIRVLVLGLVILVISSFVPQLF